MNRLAAEMRTRFVKIAEAREAGVEGLQMAMLGGIIGAACLVLALAFKTKIESYWNNAGL